MARQAMWRATWPSAIWRMALGVALGAVAGEAAAVVGGVEDTGALSRAAVMVLSSRGGMCSAVVVARDAVLTAAHCAGTTGSAGSAGATDAGGAGGAAGRIEYRVHFRDEAGAPVLISPAAIAVHPGYAADAVAARRPSVDLALLRLPEPLPARFEAATLAAASPGAGSTLVLGGYGVLREGDARSTGTFRSAKLAVTEPYGPSRILVWLKGDNTGACLGDSGGPVAIRSPDGADTVVAVTAWAKGPRKGGRDCGDLSQAVRLGPERDWIDRTLAAWGRSARWR